MTVDTAISGEVISDLGDDHCGEIILLDCSVGLQWKFMSTVYVKCLCQLFMLTIYVNCLEGKGQSPNMMA